MLMQGNDSQRIVFGRQVGFMFLLVLLRNLFNLVRLPVLTKSLGANLFGTWSLINTTVSLAVPFASIAFGTSIVRFLAAEKDQYRIRDDFLSACVVVFISGALFSILLVFSSDFLASRVLHEEATAPYFRLAAVLILLKAFQLVPLGFFRMQRRMGLYATANFLHHVLQVGLITVTVLLGSGLSTLILVIILGEVAFNLILLLLALKETGLHLPRFRNITTYLKWGIPLTPNGALLWIISVSDRYVISHLMGVTDVGIYSAAYSLGSYAILFAAALRSVTYPNVVKSFDEGALQETQQYLKHSFRLLMFLSIPSAVGLSVLSRTLLTVLTTSEFVSGSWVVPLVAFGSVLFAVYQIPISIFHIVNRTHMTVRLIGFAALLNVGLNYLLIPHMGLVGAAVATLVAYGTLGTLTLVVTRRYLRFSLSPIFLMKVILSSVVMGAGVWVLRPTSIGSIILAIVVGASIYAAMVLITGAITRKERSFLLALAKDTLGRVWSLFDTRRR